MLYFPWLTAWSKRVRNFGNDRLAPLRNVFAIIEGNIEMPHTVNRRPLMVVCNLESRIGVSDKFECDAVRRAVVLCKRNY